MENNKKIIYIIVTIVLLVIAVGSYFVWSMVNKPIVPIERPKTDLNTITNNVEIDEETPVL